jgi:hypothetical protein
MNAGRDVERLIAGWLDEEAAPRAPDRILDSARSSISRTGQRRLVVAWREPMYVTPIRLTGIAAVLAAAIVGAAWFGRMSAPAGGVGGQPAPTPSQIAQVVSLESYREARDAICHKYVPEADALKAQLSGITDPGLPQSERAAKVDALRQLAEQGDAFVAELAELEVPDALVAEHAANLANYRDIMALIRRVAGLVTTGDLAGAAAVDAATDPVAGAIGAYERKYRLVDCP